MSDEKQVTHYYGDGCTSEDGHGAERDERRIIERARDAVSDMCNGRRRWTMSVPAEPERDHDLVITAALDLASRLLDERRHPFECERSKGHAGAHLQSEPYCEWTAPETPPAAPPDRETVCQRCGGTNPISWHAPSPLWNAVMRRHLEEEGELYGFCCPSCFIVVAQEAGIDGAWHLSLDGVEYGGWVFSDGRVWDANRCLWVDTPVEGAPPPETAVCETCGHRKDQHDQYGCLATAGGCNSPSLAAHHFRAPAPRRGWLPLRKCGGYHSSVSCPDCLRMEAPLVAPEPRTSPEWVRRTPHPENKYAIWVRGAEAIRVSIDLEAVIRAEERKRWEDAVRAQAERWETMTWGPYTNPAARLRALLDGPPAAEVGDE